MNPQPVSLADELRKLEQKWRELARKAEEDSANYTKRLGLGEIITVTNGRFKDLREVCSDELSALLAQHAVAEPQVSGTKVREILEESSTEQEVSSGADGVYTYRHCDTYEVANRLNAMLPAAHAAEQPKLTEAAVLLCDSVQKFLNEEGGPDNTTNRVMLRISLVRARRELTLLTSPVAPPPQREKFHETIGYETDYMRGRREMREEIASGDAPPPVAPGEQPPLCPECGSDITKGHHSKLHGCWPTGAQERASDELIMRAYTAWTDGAQKVYDEFKEIRATAAKLAREEALESISEITKRWHAEAMKLLDKTKNATDRVEQLTLRKCAEQIDDAIRLAAQPSPQKKEGK